MLPISLLLAASAWAGDSPLEVQIDDASVLAVILECGGGTQLKAMVRDGVARFAQVPHTACSVNLLKRGGTIDSPGKWTCTLNDCSQNEVHHLDVINADGRINVVLPGLPPGANIEVQCPDGYRQRSPVVENTASFEDVPQDRCTLMVKGAVPARFSPITWGTWFCTLTGTTAVCHQKL